MINVNDSVNPRVIRLNSYRHLCELGFILCLILIVCGAVVLKDEQRLLWVIVLSVGALLSLVFAYLLSSRAIREYVCARFEIDDRRLMTLSAIPAPLDLINCLTNLSPNLYSGERAYFAEIEREIGSASRCADLKDLIFKYTYVGTPRR